MWLHHSLSVLAHTYLTSSETQKTEIYKSRCDSLIVGYFLLLKLIILYLKKKQLQENVNIRTKIIE